MIILLRSSNYQRRSKREMSAPTALFNQLVINLSNMRCYNLSNDYTIRDFECGSPDATSSTISLIYSLSYKHPELLRQQIEDKSIFDYLMMYAREHLKDDYSDYLSDMSIEDEGLSNIDDYILTTWWNMNENPSDYYQGNGCYDEYGMCGIQLRRLLKNCQNN